METDVQVRLSLSSENCKQIYTKFSHILTGTMETGVQVRLSLGFVHRKQYTAFSHILTGTMVTSVQVRLSLGLVHRKQYTKFSHIVTGLVAVIYYHLTLQQYVNIDFGERRTQLQFK